jgi:hypothetical protein
MANCRTAAHFLDGEHLRPLMLMCVDLINTLRVHYSHRRDNMRPVICAYKSVLMMKKVDNMSQ